jgi:hypothetical protein
MAGKIPPTPKPLPTNYVGNEEEEEEEEWRRVLQHVVFATIVNTN